MSNVKKIEQDIRALSTEELATFREWFLEFDSKASNQCAPPMETTDSTTARRRFDRMLAATSVNSRTATKGHKHAQTIQSWINVQGALLARPTFGKGSFDGAFEESIQLCAVSPFASGAPDAPGGAVV